MRALTGLLCAVALLSKEHGADAGSAAGGADNAANLAKMQAQVMSLASMTGAICEAMCKQVQAFPACGACRRSKRHSSRLQPRSGLCRPASTRQRQLLHR